MAAPTSPALSPSAPSLLALEPAIKIPDGDAGYLVTLGAPNTWWIVNTAEEVVALLRTTWQDLNGRACPPPVFMPHAIADAPGALFVKQGAVTSPAPKASPVEVVHALMERAKTDPSIHNVGPHVIRVVPVMGTCDACIASVEALASQLLSTSFPLRKEGAAKESFAVQLEAHTPRIRDTSAQDLVRRVAEVVPKESYKVDLAYPDKFILLLVVGQNVMISVVDDWHELHKYNLKRCQEEAASDVAY